MPAAGTRTDGHADSRHSPRIFRGEQRIAAVASDDRGLAYGDGLFETMRGVDGTLPWWPRHWARLHRGAERLQLPLPPQALARSEAEDLLCGGEGVIKLLLTRGGGGRGYAPPERPVPTWVLSVHALPPATASIARVRWCRTRLAAQPALAGIKHCNRLEQVLARAEWATAAGGQSNPGTAVEGLMLSMEGDAVCAIAANLLVLTGGRWRTPLLDRCGVEGTMREWVLEQMPVDQVRMAVAEVESADALVLVNAVRGILQVLRLGERMWQPHTAVAELQSRLAAAHPAFFLPLSGPDPLELP